MAEQASIIWTEEVRGKASRGIYATKLERVLATGLTEASKARLGLNLGSVATTPSSALTDESRVTIRR